MLQVQKKFPPQELEMSEPTPEESGLVDKAFLLVATLRQHYRVIAPIALAVTLLIAGALTTYLWIAPPVYTAKAQVVLDRGRSTFLQQHGGVVPEAPVDSAQLDGEIQVLTSGRIAALAAKGLHLEDDPQFTASASGLTDTIKNFFRRLGVLKPNAKSDFDPVQAAALALLTNLQVTRLGLSYIIEITYQARKPEQAIQIVNAIAEAYIEDQTASKRTLQHKATDWLQQTATELRQQAVASEEAVNAYKAKNNIVTTGKDGASITEQEIGELNKQLVDARARTSDILARLNRIESVLRCSDTAGRSADRQVGEPCPERRGTELYGTVSDLLTNPIVTKFRQQYLELVNREAEYSARYGPDHAAVVNLRNQIRDVQNSILNELRRLADSYKSDYVIAKQRQDAVDKDLARAVVQSQSASKAQAALRELESKAQSTRTVYEMFLQRYTESLSQQTNDLNAEAHVLSLAGIALQKPGLKPALIVALSIFAGLGTAAGLALLRVVTDRVFRTTAQLETALQVPCTALVPLVKDSPQPSRAAPRGPASGPRLIFRGSDVFWTVLEAPLSRFTESIRAIKLAVDLQRVDGLGTIVGFTSSLPNEGKTTTAAALALLMGQVGHRVLMIDCDLRNPSLTRALAPHATAGLVEVVRGHKSVEEVSWRFDASGLMFVPAIVGADLWHTSEILASAATKRLFEHLRTRYDYIVVDLPPLAPIIDVRATAHLVDFYFLVVEWGVTKTDVVKHTLKDARPVLERMLGAVLNKTDIDQMANYDRLKSEYYKNKYYERYGYTS